MNLWIVKQNGEKIVKTTNIQINFDSIICFDNYEGIITLAIYKNHKRAKQIFDEIKNKLMRKEVGQNTLVYEMPKE